LILSQWDFLCPFVFAFVKAAVGQTQEDGDTASIDIRYLEVG
jgi:hypothetical protein